MTAQVTEEITIIKNIKKIYKKTNTQKHYGHSLNNQKDQNSNIGKNKNGNKSTEYLLKIVQLNVEGMTKSKAELISHVFHYADILALQETHISDDQLGKLKIPGFQLIDYIGHKKHGMATFLRQDLDPKNIKRIEENEHTVGIEIGNTKIFNIYKPPSENWTTSVLPLADHPAVYIGDFNSHNTEWGYNSTDDNGEKLSNLVQLNHLQLLYDAKQGGTFKSGRWGSITSPDLCFVTTDASKILLKVNRRILQEFPKSQHIPVQVDIGLNLPIVSKPKLNRWNVRKADWAKYTTYIEENINHIEPITSNYDRFTKLIKMAAGKAMPRGHRQD